MFPTLSQELFEKLRAFIYQETAISLSERKYALVQSRLQRRLKALKLKSFDDYYDYLHKEGNHDEIARLIDAISTNVTSFFREESQWVFLKEHADQLMEWYRAKKKLRVWSAACSSGQEPYSIAMFLLENLPDAGSMDIRILATDISGDILAKAMAGRYTEQEIGDMSPVYRDNYFTQEKENGKLFYKVVPKVRQMILFRQFNLTRGDFSIFGKTDIDIIFCRNVMIYFDADTKQQLFSNFHGMLRSGTWLFLGHSESVTGDMLRQFKMQRPSIYRRV